MKKAFAVLCLALAAGCGSSATPRSYPLLTPPVQAAAPRGLGGAPTAGLASARAALSAPATLDLADVKSRFFTEGPTSLYRILGDVDARIQGLGVQAAEAKCATQDPVKYTIQAWGQSVDMYAQCYDVITGPGGAVGLVQWASMADGTFYLWVSIGAGSTAAIATPAAGAATSPAAARYAVRIWTTVGLTQTPWDSGSYTVIQVTADGPRKVFELAAAGLGIGYCGVQLASDGSDVYVKGSPDMGATCAPVADACVTAADVGVAATCSDAQQAFALAPLGRKATQGTTTAFAASPYPAAPAVVLDGTAGDDVHFGPTTPTPGVGAVAP